MAAATRQAAQKGRTERKTAPPKRAKKMTALEQAVQTLLAELKQNHAELKETRAEIQDLRETVEARYHTPKGYARLTGIAEQTVYQMLRTGELEHTANGTRKLIPHRMVEWAWFKRADVERWSGLHGPELAQMNIRETKDNDAWLLMRRASPTARRPSFNP